MAYELKPGQGSIFKNDKKTQDNHPEYRGTIKTPDGKEWEVSLWVKEGQKGKFFSANFKEPYRKDNSNHSAISGNSTGFDPNDPGDLPF